MDARKNVTNRLPHGTLWSRGLSLAEAEIGGPEPSGRWVRRSRSAQAAPEAWTPEAGPEEGIGTERWAAQAA